MNKPFQPTRRDLVVGATVVSGSLLVGCSLPEMLSLGSKFEPGVFGPFLKFAADGTVTVISKHIEFGQGNHAGLAAIAAEELDADWSKVRVEQAPANAKLYGNALMGGTQGTGGSSAINNSWTQLRTAGAAAREMFVQAAAKTWSVPAAEIKVADGVVSHASGKQAGFGELLAEAAKITPPESAEPEGSQDLHPDRHRPGAPQGHSWPSATGTARYTQDVQAAGHAGGHGRPCAALRRQGEELRRHGGQEGPRRGRGLPDPHRRRRGGRQHLGRPQGRDALKVEWDSSKAEKRGSDQIWPSTATAAAGKGPKDKKSAGSRSTPRATPPRRDGERAGSRPTTSPTWRTPPWSR